MIEGCGCIHCAKAAPTPAPKYPGEIAKAGDVVKIRGTVVSEDSGAHVDVRLANGEHVMIHRDNVTSLETRPLQVGDRVRRHVTNLVGEIKAISDDGYAFVRYDHSGYGAPKLADLVRA